jgi:hypothetical protein
MTMTTLEAQDDDGPALRSNQEAPQPEQTPAGEAVGTPEGSPLQSRFAQFSAGESRKRHVQCADFTSYARNTDYCPDNSPWIQDENLEVLALADCKYIAQAFPVMGLIGVDMDSICSTSTSSIEHIRRVLAHERTHLHIESSIRQFFLQKHRDVDDLLHQRIIPDWVDGKVEIETSMVYLLLNFWKSLKENDVASIIDNYVALLKKGMLEVHGKIISSHNLTPKHESWKKTLSDTPDIPLEELYGANRKGVTVAVATLYELLDYFMCFRCAQEEKGNGLDLNLMEEAFGHYIGAAAADMFQIPGAEGNREYELANRLLAKGYPARNAIDEVKSSDDLTRFFTKMGVEPVKLR